MRNQRESLNSMQIACRLSCLHTSQILPITERPPEETFIHTIPSPDRKYSPHPLSYNQTYCMCLLLPSF